MDNIWKESLSIIKLGISPTHFRTWFGGSCLEKIDGDNAYINVKNRIAKDYFENDFKDIIEDSLGKIIEKKVSILVSIKQKKSEDIIEHINNKEENIFFQLEEEKNKTDEYNEAIKQVGLNPKYVFDTFIVGNSNRLAHAAAYAVAQNPGTTYNPLFIYGDTGLGKTHLIQAISNFLLKKNPQFKLVYCSSEVFLNEMVSSIKSGNAANFRKKYREKDMLIIDDIQFIESKKGTQEEIFHTFNSMYQYNKQIIIVSDRPPEEMNFLDDRLKSRFEGGMVVDISKPEYETRLAIVEKKCEEKHIELKSEIKNYIANTYDTNIREIEGAIIKLSSANIIGKSINSIAEASHLLGKKNIQKKHLRVKPSSIIEEACNVLDIKQKDILGKSRSAKVATARQIIMYILRVKLNMSLIDIAKEVNRTDHTTVLHAIKKIELILSKDSDLKDDIDRIINNLFYQ